MADQYEISFSITEKNFSLKTKIPEMSKKLAEALKELFLDIAQINYCLECVKFSCGCKKSLISKKLIETQIDYLNCSFDQFGKVMREHEIFQVSTDPWIILKMSSGEKFVLMGGAIFSPR